MRERRLNALDNDLLELGVNLGSHLSLSDVSEEFLLRRLEVLLEAARRDDEFLGQLENFNIFPYDS